MIPTTTLTLDEGTNARLLAHLYPGDGLEAAAILVCTTIPGPRVRLLARDLILVPYGECGRRTESSLTWPGAYIERAIDQAGQGQLCLMLVHSHPTGYPSFSATDDASDCAVMTSIFEAGGDIHGSAVVLPNGAMLARLYKKDGITVPVDLISIAGDDLLFWWNDDLKSAAKRPVAFTTAMTAELSRLTACVIGVSGTGSIVAEQVCRLGFGRVILIDHDIVEEKNLNRILNMTSLDAQLRLPKAHAFAARANQFRNEVFVTGISENVLSRPAVLAASQADVIFSCVDTHRGRSVADRIASSFLMPLFDVGVAIPTRAAGDRFVIDEVTGRVDYVKPGGATLADRGVYTPSTLQAEALAESDPHAHAEQVHAGYIEGIPEQAPSVISLNMRAASACVLEFIARAYPFRHEPNKKYARTRFMLAEGLEEHSKEADFSIGSNQLRARGKCEPLLGLPTLAPARQRHEKGLP